MRDQLSIEQKYQDAVDIIDILNKANKNGDFKEATTRQKVNFKDLIKQLNSLKTEEERINLLTYEYLGLYFLVCSVKRISTKEFREFCKNLDTKNHPELMVFYIHGWLIPHLEELRQQNKLHKGKKEVEIEGLKHQYEGELNEQGKAYG